MLDRSGCAWRKLDHRQRWHCHFHEQKWSKMVTLTNHGIAKPAGWRCKWRLEGLSIITISAESGPVDQLKGRSTEGCHRGHPSCHHSEHSPAQEDQPFPKCLSVIVLWQTHANAWWSTFQILPKVDPAWSDNVGSIKIVYPQQINQFTLRVALSLVGSIPFSHLYIPATTQKQRSRETTEQRNRKTNKNSEAEREKFKKNNWHNYHNFL